MKKIHYFNPGHENAVLNRTPSYTAPASMTTLMKELSSLPMWYASSDDDLVFVDDKVDVEYRAFLQEKGLKLPQLLVDTDLRDHDASSICMWGITPQAIRIFESINRGYSLSLEIPKWNDEFIYLNSRQIAIDVLSEIKLANSYFDYLELPIICENLNAVNCIVKCPEKSFLAKAPYSSSGRGLLWLPHGKLTRVEEQILSGIFNKQKYLTVEKVYDKVIDFALEFMSDGRGNINFVGYSLFQTSSKGAYQANELLHQSKIEQVLYQYVDKYILSETKSLLCDLLVKYYAFEYSGCIGVDMMIVREDNHYKIHPCVEINMRYNMGYLSIKLFEQHVHSTSCGKYYLDFDKSGKLFLSHQELQKEFPLKIVDNKLKSGYLSLCPINVDTKYRAYIIIED